MFNVNKMMVPSYIISLFRESNNRPDICIGETPHNLQDQSSFLRFFLLEFAAISIKTAGTIKRFQRE